MGGSKIEIDRMSELRSDSIH